MNSCSHKQGDPILYRKSPFKARIVSVGFEVDFEALVTSETQENEEGQALVFEFLSPDSLKGLEARISDQGTEISLNGKQFANIEFPESKGLGLFRIAEMLVPSEPILNIKSKSGQACGMPDLKALTVISTPNATIYISPETGFPIKSTTPDGDRYLIINVISSEG